MVITSLTRNQVYRKVPWVRIPPPPPEKPSALAGGFFLPLSPKKSRNTGVFAFLRGRGEAAFGDSGKVTKREGGIWILLCLLTVGDFVNFEYLVNFSLQSYTESFIILFI